VVTGIALNRFQIGFERVPGEHINSAPTRITVRQLSRRLVALVLLWGVITLATGCAARYPLYDEPIQQLEQSRSFDGTVGIMVWPHPAKVEDIKPARGAWGGFTRGFVVGAAAPIAIGFVSPVPGGTFIGALLAPVTGLIGGVMGAIDALPAETVDAIELELESASRRLEAMNLKQSLAAQIQTHGEHTTGRHFTQLPWPESEEGVPGLSVEDVAAYSHVDAILEIVVTRVGLSGEYRIDPPSSAFAETRARLLSTADGGVLLESTVNCHSEPRKYAQWGEAQGKALVDAFIACVPPMAHKIVEDLFLVWPDPVAAK
jgi:hypothetical protein